MKNAAAYEPSKGVDSTKVAGKGSSPSPGSKSKGSSERSPEVEKRYVELVLIIQCESVLSMNAVDKDGALIPEYCISTSPGSLPSCMGFTVIGSDLHMIGGYSPGKDSDIYSLNTYALAVPEIPQAVASGHGLSPLVANVGQPLNGPKIRPALFLVQDHIYALSSTVHGPDSPSSDFEVRRLEEPAPAWTKLQNPPVPSDVRPFASIESHALAGQISIVVSLKAMMGNWRGEFIFYLEQNRWAALDKPNSIRSIGRSTISVDGFCYAPSHSALLVFEVGRWSWPIRNLEIRETSPLVKVCTAHAIVMMGDVAFVFRSGSPQALSESVHYRDFYVTLDRYKVSRCSDHVTGQCQHSIEYLDPELNHPDFLLPKDEDKACGGSAVRPYGGSTVSPYYLPIDAFIHFESDGGPACNSQGNCVGIAFKSQKHGAGPKIGYVIPTPIIAHFIQDYEKNGKYPGFPILGFEWQTMENPSLREAMGMKTHQTGVRVKRIDPTAPVSKVLKVEDIILSFDGVHIDNSGNAPFGHGDRFEFTHLLYQKHDGDVVAMEVLRNSQILHLNIWLKSGRKLIPAHVMGKPSYYIVAGFVFTTLSTHYLDSKYGKDYGNETRVKLLDKLLRTPYDEQVVVLSQVLVADITRYHMDIRANSQVLALNGMPVKNLKSLVTMVESCDDEFLEFELDSQLVVLETESVKPATLSVLAAYCIPSAMSDDLKSGDGSPLS